MTAVQEERRGRRPRREPLLRNAYALLLNTAGTSVLGLAATLVTARLYDPAAVGRNTALVSAMLLVSVLAQLNLAGGLPRFLAVTGAGGPRLVRAAYLASGTAAVLGGIAFVLVAPLVTTEWRFLRTEPLVAVAFCVAVVAWGVFALQDSALTGLRAARWVLVKNQAFGLAKLILLVVLASAVPAYGIGLSWLLPVLVALVPVNVLLFRRLLPEHARTLSAAARPVTAGEVRRFVAADYVGLLAAQGYGTLLPLLVFALAGAEGSAPFALAYSVAAALDMVAYNVGSSLTVEGAREPARLGEYARRVLGRGVAVLLAVVVAVSLAAPLLVVVAGPAYAPAVPILALLALASLPRLVVILDVAAARVRGDVRRIVLVQAATSVATVGAAVLLYGPLGPTGIALGAAIGAAVVAVAVLPHLLRRRSPGVG